VTESPILRVDSSSSSEFQKMGKLTFLVGSFVDGRVEFLANERVSYWKCHADYETCHDLVADLRHIGILASCLTRLLILAHNFVGAVRSDGF
jgi:hypothetical protein